jgi:hypothetical protein
MVAIGDSRICVERPASGHSRFFHQCSAGVQAMVLRAVGALFLTSLISARLFAQGFDESSGIARQHLDFAGKPCLQSVGVSRPLASNPHILNHAVSLKNHCPDRIKVKVCYYGTNDCTDVDVPPNSSKEQVIGVFPAVQMFRYQVKESF